MRIQKVLIGIVILCLIGAAYWSFNTLKNINIFNGPSYTVDTSRDAVIKQLQTLERYETASFTIEKVIDAGTTGNTFQEFLYGDRILLIAHGQVIAGFDFSKLTREDIQVTGSSVTLNLPKPEIMMVSLDNDKTRVFDRKLGLLNRGNKDLESKARAAAEDSISKAACQGKILDEAAKNAREQLTVLLKALHFTEVTINIPVGEC